MKSEELVKMLGDPTTKGFQQKYLVVVEVPTNIQKAIPSLGKRLYMNSLMAKYLFEALNELIQTGLYKEIKTFDGIYNVRKQRGSATAWSYHAFGLAIDLNATHNARGFSVEQLVNKGLVPFSDSFLNVWRRNGFTSGEDFKVNDRMHFQLNDNLIKPFK